VLGLGLMGRPIARTLSAAGLAVRGWNRTSLPLQQVTGIDLAEDLETATQADVVVIMVSDSVATGALLKRASEHLRPDTVVVDMGSSEPGDSVQRAAALARLGVGWVDAPVSGGPAAARDGSLAIMAGASRHDFERVASVLDALGSNVTHAGGPGAGHAMKIVNQVIVGLCIETVAEAMALAAALGFDVNMVQRAVAGGSADNPQVRVQGSRMQRRQYAPGGRVSTVLKDLRMAARLADEHSLDLPLLRITLEAYARAAANGAGDEDCAVLFEARALDGWLRERSHNIGSTRDTS
jgi:2-hydroxy-3-oxopropionate reductase